MDNFKITAEQLEKIWSVVKEIPTEKGIIVVDIIRNLTKIEEDKFKSPASDK